MIYRSGKPEDLDEISGLITNGDYYLHTDAAALGGQWIVAENNDGRIVGVIWFFTQAPHAYIDYYYVHPAYRNTYVAGRLGVRLKLELQRHGVRYVRGSVLAHNTTSLRMAEAFGMLADPGYALVYKEI